MTLPDTMAAILARGATYRTLGDVLGLDRDAARMRARRAGLRSLHRKRPPNPETPRRVKVARAMLTQGCELQDVAERLGMSAAAVRAMLRRART
ncbi:hypothetical protein J8J14_18150 [Roseomonas sp. SSH11]|uniref:RNA polymerase sigma factor 70 region 4 type 2 domain-containing protein n=1 Tax=Pararoseomonas baculiformis TaxID=2820812 RepID=A0ABS4AI39_9PROT|nr:hypothetical protein [Pararoseomonas baculiformis]MBP0446702.1 hypothetical protein [Pararoseomonas baculiformis]